ncbi:MAG: DUF6894 family protein [Brevundimonas sp.]
MQSFVFESDAGPEGRRIRWESSLASVREAQVEAVRTLGELLRDDGVVFWSSPEARMTVSSPQGEILFQLVLSSMGTPAPAALVRDERQEDPEACRKALWEMREIAAAAALQDSPMSDQEALHTLAAIAAWVQTKAPADGAACGAVIDLLVNLTVGVDIDALDDAQATTLFRRIEKSLAV